MTVGRLTTATTGYQATGQVQDIWATDLYSEAEDATFWGQFEGSEGSGMPVIRKDDLEKTPADELKYDIVLALSGTGSQIDAATDSTFSTEATLTEGNEEAIEFSQISMKLASLRHAVRWNWLTDLLITHDMRSTALHQLRKWLAGKIDDRIFLELTGKGSTAYPDSGRIAITATGPADAATETTYVEATNALTLDDIVKAKAYAQSTLRIEPVRVSDGVEVFGLVIHPLVEKDLKVSADYKQAMREAEVRGKDNPLFSGASAVYDGVVIYVSNRVPEATTALVKKNVFFGAQAMCRGYAKYPTWVEQEFSYGEEIGIATRLVLGEKLNVFDLTSGVGVGLQAIGSFVVASKTTAAVA